MDILKIFKLADNDITINIQGTIDDPLFQANQIGELLGISNIRDTTKNFDDDEKVVDNTYTLGGLQKTTFLTELGLYRLLGMSRKPIARTFQKWVCNTIKEIRINGKYELNNNIEIEKKLNESRIEQERHKILLEKLNNKRTFYITRVYIYQNGKFIIKLGWSNGIQDRNRSHRNHFGSSLLLDVFECNKNCEFELFLKRHPYINRFAYKEPIIDEIRSTETFLIDINEYNNIIKIIKKNIDNYQGFNHEQYIEIENIKLKNKEIDLKNKVIELFINDSNTDKEKIIDILSKINIKKDIQSDNTISNVKPIEFEEELESETDDELDNQIVNKNVPRKNTRNRKVQQYDPISFELIKTFDGLMDVIRNMPNMNMTVSGIKNAYIKNTIYNGYRWLLIDRNDEGIKYELPPTVEITSSIPYLIAMFTKDDKTRIENVFASHGEAAEGINITRKQTINDAIKKNSLVRNKYYFKNFYECSEELKNEYLSRSKLPNPILRKGLKITQIDIKTQNIIAIFNSINDVLKKFCMSRASLKRACTNQEAHKGFLWKFVD